MRQYTTLNYTIDANALTLTSTQGHAINIRPKTCQLLIVLLKSQGNVVSKAQLLDKVWSDSVVDEQVVFQSIKELRKIFNDDKVIKTLPKQGYIWLPNATVITSDDESPINNTKKTNQFSYFTVCLALIAIAVITIASIVFIMSQDQTKPVNRVKSSVNGSVIILPTENLISGNDHGWIRLGMMDQLIQRLPSNDKAGVLQTDDVLQVLERAKVPLSQVDINHIPDIFTVSGAELIVATKLSGSPSDYQLSYTLYRRKSQQRGVLFNKDSQALIDELSTIVALQIGNTLPLNSDQYLTDFHDEMLGVAIDLRLEGNFKQAIPLLTSIVNNNPNNLTAQRLLIESYLQNKDLPQMAEQLERAIGLARQLSAANELIRLLYFKGIYLYVTKKPEASKTAITEGLNIANAHNEWLFKAYLTELKATLAMQAKQYDQAEQLYKEALGYHRILKCPLGETQSWILLSKLAEVQNDPQKQKIALDKAYHLATQRNLTKQIIEIKDLKNKI